MTKNKKGFTLIELLAVIIIMGVLLLVAIPAVSRYMDNSRQNTYINSIKNLIKAVSTSVNAMEYPLIPGDSEAIIVPFSEINLEKKSAKTKSPYGNYVADKSYVVVMHDGSGYSYYAVALDEVGFAIPFIGDKSLGVNSITSNANEIANNIYSLNEIKNAKDGNVVETDSLTLKFLQESNNIIKVKVCQTPYDMGDIVQLKDGTKYYVIQGSDEESKTVDLLTYYHMSLTATSYGKQTNSKTDPRSMFDTEQADYEYVNSDIYPMTESIVANVKTNLIANNIDLINAVIRMPQVEDFGCDKVSLKCPGTGYRLNYLVNNADGSFWTTDSSDEKVFIISNGSAGKATSDTYHGVRIVIKNILKSNIDKQATKTLN